MEIADNLMLPMSIENLIEGSPCPCDIFIQEDGITRALFNKGMIFDASTLSFLRKRSITEVLIRADDFLIIEPRSSPNAIGENSSSNTHVFEDYPSQKDLHYQIDKALLTPDTNVNFNIYVLNWSGINKLVDASEKSPQRLQKSVANVDGDLVIRNADIELYQAYLNALLVSSKLPPKEQSRMQSIAIKENSKLIIKDLLENPRSGEKIKASVTMVNKMVDNILDNKDAIYELLSIRTHDYYTYTHSVNVAALSVGLGIAAGLNRSELEKLGIGTMLHDLGKSAIPLAILNKQGKLTDDEFRIMKTHVVESEKLLKKQREIPEESYIAVLQHHEKISGKGYPFGLSGTEVKMFGRISAIADCYDAITTQRSYKPAFTPFHALSIIVNEIGHYDTELLAVFIKMLGKIT
ncbi:MAG TPA: HD-GYP domain-containing protein [Nitrospirota bacterium]|nr:HD-GYP domain-containing protein [Nitrospirota bacterium]